jgi:hypothetical protein
MTDQVIELVAASNNFRFLAELSLQLAGDAAIAESYVYSDPDAALHRARRFAETLVKLALDRFGLPYTPRQPYGHGINTLSKARVIPESLREILRKIRADGNEAVHAGSGDPDKAAAAVRACFELGRWWHRTVSGREINITYAPLKPGESSTPRELLQKVERQLGELQAALDRSLARGSGNARRPGPVITIGTAAPDRYRWRAGSVVEYNGSAYLVHEPVGRIAADDGSWTLMQADGHGMDADGAPVRLRGVVVEQPDNFAIRMVEGLAAQAAYLDGRRRRSLPELLSRMDDGKLHVMVTTRPAGSTWYEMFSGGAQGLDPLIVPLALDALANVADALVDLHRKGVAHRDVSGESILIVRPGRRGVLRDLGLAWWPRLRDEGGDYRASEQSSIARGQLGPATDIYQLAALMWHTFTGIRPGTGPAFQLGTLLPGFPAQLDSLLAQALDPDPARRPETAAFAVGLRDGRRRLAVEAGHGH